MHQMLLSCWNSISIYWWLAWRLSGTKKTCHSVHSIIVVGICCLGLCKTFGYNICWKNHIIYWRPQFLFNSWCIHCGNSTSKYQKQLSHIAEHIFVYWDMVCLYHRLFYIMANHCLHFYDSWHCVPHIDDLFTRISLLAG